MYISLIIIPSCKKTKDYRKHQFTMINIISPSIDNYLERTRNVHSNVC